MLILPPFSSDGVGDKAVAEGTPWRWRHRRWREERRGAVVLLARLADDDADLLRGAANEVADEWADRDAARLLLDAATLAEIGA